MKLPLLATASLLAVCASYSIAKADPVDFTYTGGFQSFTAATAGTYDILAFGAQGGSIYDAAGGLGAEIGGNLALTAGEVLRIAVGGAGTNGSDSADGGGGSFVVGPGNTPLVIAAGGGGGNDTNGGLGQTGTAGGNGIVYRGGGTWLSGAGGTGGSGGTAGGAESGAGGGGFKSSGGNGYGYGGRSFAAGLNGSPAGNSFGGGGSASFDGGGGGGGYSGGGGALGAGGGGGSFDGGTSQVLLAGVNAGNGSVTITDLTPPITPVPEPASLALLGTALLGLGLAKRRAS